MTVVDIIALILIILGALLGFKKGAIKSLVQLIGLIAITIVAFQFKDNIGNLLIKHLPFINWGGTVDGLYSLNLLFYQSIAFIVVFVLLYCLLNILIDLSGIVEFLLKLTIILEIPSKILGAILGAVESLVFVFILGTCLLTFNQTQKYVMESKITIKIVERTPIVNMIFRTAIGASENIYKTVEDYRKADNKEAIRMETNLEIIRHLIKYEIVDAGLVQECINNGKLHMDNVVVAS